MQWLNTRFLASFILGLLTGVALTADAYIGGAHEARFAMLLVVLNALHAVWRPRFYVCRELVLYLVFVAYTVITLLWTENVLLGLDTVLLEINFALVMLLLSALVFYHAPNAALKGMMAGFLLGAAAYFALEGFPLVYPDDFSYNTMAGMYLFGLLLTVVFGWYFQSRVVPIGLGLILVLHIAATTSIKTNLGVALGALAAGVVYLRDSLRVLGRNLLVLTVLLGVVAYVVVSNKSLMDRLESGSVRVFAGAEILASREEDTGNSGIATRQYWKNEGLKGWRRNPVLGYGVEAFRADYGITSHSTPIDLLYNSGIIGCTLFYSMFASLAWRVVRTRGRFGRGLQALTVAGLVCYSFMSLSGTLYYDTYVAAFVAICAGALTRLESGAARSESAASRPLVPWTSQPGIPSAATQRESQ